MGNSDHGATYMTVGGHDGELRPWHYIYVYSIANGNPNRRTLELILQEGSVFLKVRWFFLIPIIGGNWNLSCRKVLLFQEFCSFKPKVRQDPQIKDRYRRIAAETG